MLIDPEKITDDDFVLNNATYFNIEQHYHESEEYESAMMYLDNQGIPRNDIISGETYSLVGRIELYANKKDHNKC